MSNIVQSDITVLLDGWIEAEQNGVAFPVPFEMAWRMAEYSTKASAKRELKSLKKGNQFSTEMLKTAGGGRSSELINLSVDGLKHFCLMADTEAGEAIRNYFIEAEKKWKLVQLTAPAVAQEVEILAMRIELAKIEERKTLAENNLLAFRHVIVATMPEHKQKIVLGFEMVEKIEYRDRVIANNRVIDEGETINKTSLCDRYDIKTRNGKPDYKRLNALIEGAKLPTSAWKETKTIQSDYQLRRDYLDRLDRHITGTSQQMYLGE